MDLIISHGCVSMPCDQRLHALKCSMLSYCRSDSDDNSSSSESASSDSDAPEQAKAWQGSASGSEEDRGTALAVWPADSLLSRWRAASRECHVYAYAPPTRYFPFSLLSTWVYEVYRADLAAP